MNSTVNSKPCLTKSGPTFCRSTLATVFDIQSRRKKPGVGGNERAFESLAVFEGGIAVLT